MSFMEEFAHVRIPFEDILQATNNFADEHFTWRDDYGKTYKGVLLQPEGVVTVAFTRLHIKASRQASQEFCKEIMRLSRYRHENIISLVGFCDEGNEMIVVTEFATHGSLDRYLSSDNLTWLKRLQICLDAARGLNYLHNPPQSQLRVLHGDLKSTNIILDENWHAKLTNFGISMLRLRNEHHRVSTISNVAHSLCYLAPQYIESGILTKESDIYSFGIILMEVLCGRLAYEEGKEFLRPMACRHYEEGKLTEIIHPIIRKQMSPDSLNVFSAIAYQCLKSNRHERPPIVEVVRKLEVALELQQVKTMDHMKIPLKDIKSATHDFHEHFKIGRGGFGEVYKADLFHFDFRKYVAENRFQKHSSAELSVYPRRQGTVAIKRLDRRYGQGPVQFLQELSVLPFLTHKNLVTLVGFCDEDGEHILVYEYAPNGSLHDHIQTSNTTNSHTWARRLQICLDAASGLEFLHNGLGEHYRIIHRDIKSSNILLGQNYIGMISDFGLSKIGPANLEATFVMTQAAGTPLYIDPQYQKTDKLTKESDVYSFGVVLFEALSGRLVHSGSSKDDPQLVLNMAKRCFEQRNVKEIIHSNFKSEFEKAGLSLLDDESCPESIRIFAAIAYKCCKDKREERPTMVEVVKKLEKALKYHVNRVEATRITLGDIRSATNDFRDIIEQGPPADVYCGELSHLKGSHGTVTIKRLHHSMDSDGEEFVKEIGKLYSYSHENIVPVLGFCEEGIERIIVFEHMVKGSLKENLTNTSLTWKQRLKICIDVAYGLAYIHSHAEREQMIHGDLKSSSILLGDDWKASISDFIVFKGAGTLGYLDPIYANTSSLTQESDIYSFGVVLFEILSGRLATETIKIDRQLPLGEVRNVEPQLINSARGSGDERMIFLANWASKCFKNKKVEDIIFHAIKKEIEPISLVIFSTIAYQCLMEQRDDRPTMTKVVEELEKALDCQDEWEWEQKLPTDYKEIIQMSKRPVASTIRKKDIHSLLTSGMLLHNEKWFSITMDGARNEMASAKTFSFGDVSSVKWKSVQKSRFPKVARISDISNLNIQIQITTQFLTPEMMYGAYLVFKFCDRRKVSSRPLYVNLKYKKAGETLSAYFAEWEVGSEWLKVELFRFSSKNGSVNFEILLESLSQYYCGRGAIYIEGIEFQAIRSVDFEHNNELKDGTNSEGVLINTQLDMDWVEKMLYRYEKIIRRYGKNVHVANGIDNKEVMYRLLSEGIHIDKGEKFFSLSKSMKNCHMLRASSVIYNSLNLKFSKPPTGLRCRFAKVAKILSHQDFRIKCDIETQMLSSDTTYACFLVFKLSKKCHGLKCPVKARDLVPHRKERTKIISFTYPNIVNLDKIKWIPEQREDGWMEVIVWEFNVDSTHNDEFVPMDLRLTCFEGNMSGLIVYGIEFRPTA
ncbi:uncharacterized protein LOC111907996 isoform X2 [Lactuca sativa]|uniref:uncharacterized protein LOC111907996 isoform X2 n=1 Tax=Lactuca sativa TaxID=4236 RepID=UPI000CD96F58|nr:uncharacterized protein LOC111907996 isoform X2 [Lactuca sativa]